MQFSCPFCDVVLRAPEIARGSALNCPRCKTRINVPVTISDDDLPVAEEDDQPVRRKKLKKVAGPSATKIVLVGASMLAAAFVIVWIILSWLFPLGKIKRSFEHGNYQKAVRLATETIENETIFDLASRRQRAFVYYYRGRSLYALGRPGWARDLGDAESLFRKAGDQDMADECGHVRGEAMRIMP